MPRPKKPAKLRLIEGNRGKRPIPAEVEFAPPEKRPGCPAHLGRDGKRVRTIVLDAWESAGLLQEVDFPALEAFAFVYDQSVRLEKQVAAEGAVIEALSARGHLIKRPNPALETLIRLRAPLHQGFKAFGIGPGNRAQISREGLGGKEKTPEERLEEALRG